MIKLKKLALRDAQRYATLANDRKISGPFASVEPDDFPYPFSQVDAVGFIKFARNSMQLKRAFFFGVFKNSLLIGAAGLSNINYNTGRASISYWIGRRYWGKGYGKEAARLLIRFGFRKLKLKKIVSGALATNSRSIGILEGLGFKKDIKLRTKLGFTLKKKEFIG